MFTMFGVEQFFQTRSAIFLDRSQLVNLGVGLVAGLAVAQWLGKNLKKFKFDKIQVVCIILILFSQLSQIWAIAPEAFARYYSRGPLPYYVLYLSLIHI